MPTARESLLDAARSALADQPWGAIRMVDVAAAAGVSRQTLYNEFGSKEGIAQALARREADAFLAGVEQALSAAERQGADAGDCFAATGWMLHTARRNALVRAALTGCRGDGVPAAAVITVPAQRRPRARREDQPLTSGELIAELRARAALALEHGFPKLESSDPAHIAWVCEAAVRLALSYVVTPAARDEEACLHVARLVRGLLARAG